MRTLWNSVIGLGTFVAATQVAGCFSEVPELTDFKLSASEVARGDTVNATAMVTDDSGDLGGGTMEVTLSTESGLQDQRKLPIALPDDSASKGAISLSLEIAQRTLGGQATVKLVVIDKAGHRSNEVSAPLTIK